MPKVSVVIPIYGVEQYIERCARKLFEQTLDDIEYLFIDDCTPDRSIEILQQVLEDYPQRKPQVVIHRMEQNSGQAAVRKWGIQNATGEYIIHCDSDDWVDIDIYKELYEKAKEDGADIVICDYYKVNNTVLEYKKGCIVGEKDKLVSDLLTEQIGWAVWNKLIKKSLYQERDIRLPNGNMGEDMALTMQLVLKAKTISYLSKPLYYYVFNPISITHQTTDDAIYKKYLQFKDNTEIVLLSFKLNNIEKKYGKELLYLKWCARRSLWNLTKKAMYRFEWLHTYPEIVPSLFFSPYIKPKDKFKIILTYLALYPFGNAK